MPAYIIADVEVLDIEKYEIYRQMVPPILAAFGGRFLVRGGASETLEGGWTSNRIVVLEFPTLNQARSWWASSEYAEAKALRQSASNTRLIVAEGL